MKPQVSFPDPEAAIIRHLEQRWTGRAEPYAPDPGTGISNSVPDVPIVGARTLVQVELDGTPDATDYPMVERCTVRVTTWAGPGRPTAAKDSATRSQAFVYAHPGDDDVFSTKHLTGRLKGTDPETRNEFVSFTTRVNLRPTAL